MLSLLACSLVLLNIRRLLIQLINLIDKESEPVYGIKEITAEPEFISFNDDFLAGGISYHFCHIFFLLILLLVDQKGMYHLQTELKMIKHKSLFQQFYDKELQKTIDHHTVTDLEASHLDYKVEQSLPFPKNIKYYALERIKKFSETMRLPTLPNLPFTIPSFPIITFPQKIKDFFEEKWVLYAPDYLYHFKENELYLQFYQLKLEFGDKRRELAEGIYY